MYVKDPQSNFKDLYLTLINHTSTNDNHRIHTNLCSRLTSQIRMKIPTLRIDSNRVTTPRHLFSEILFLLLLLPNLSFVPTKTTVEVQSNKTVYDPVAHNKVKNLQFFFSGLTTPILPRRSRHAESRIWSRTPRRCSSRASRCFWTSSLLGSETLGFSVDSFTKVQTLYITGHRLYWYLNKYKEILV